jgi:hypothetical protein
MSTPEHDEPILSQKHEGWTVLPTQYDDGGYSGGTMERMTYKRQSRNHLLDQIEHFRVGDNKKSDREDDLLDTFCYGIAIALGNSEGF